MGIHLVYELYTYHIVKEEGPAIIKNHLGVNLVIFDIFQV